MKTGDVADFLFAIFVGGSVLLVVLGMIIGNDPGGPMFFPIFVLFALFGAACACVSPTHRPRVYLTRYVNSPFSFVGWRRARIGWAGTGRKDEHDLHTYTPPDRSPRAMAGVPGMVGAVRGVSRRV
jgi:hypothetical protein